MKKLLLIMLFASSLFNIFEIQAAEKFLTTTSTSKSDSSMPLNFNDLSETNIPSQLFEKIGPLGNFTLKAGLTSATISDSTNDFVFDTNMAGFVRVDSEDKKLYTFSKISPDQPIDEAQASRFQIIFLTPYEVKLFQVRPTRENKLAFSDINNSARNIFEKALLTYSDASKEPLSEPDTALLIGEFAKTIELITTGLTEQSTEDKIKDLAGFDNFVTLFKEKVSTLIAELQKLTFDKKTAQIFLNAVKAWDFGYTTKVDAAPGNDDIIIIKSTATGKYLTTVKSKDSSGADIFYISSSSDELVGATQFKVKETGGRLGFSSISGDSKDLIIKATPMDVDSGLVDSTKKKLTRLVLSTKSQKEFGSTGSEDQQFQITGTKDGFFLECMAQKNSINGYLTVDQADSNFLRVYDSSGSPLTKSETLSKFKFIIISKNKAFFDGLFESRTKTDPAQRLEIFSNLVDQASTMDNATILLDEINKFILENKTSDNGWTLFKRNFGLVANSLKAKFGKVFGDAILTTDSYKAVDDALSSAFSSTTAGMPASGDTVAIYSNAAKAYLSVTKGKLPSGEDVFYVTTTAEDPISASQFKIQTTQDGLNFGFESLNQDSAGLVLQALPPIIQSDDVDSTKRQMTRIMLSARPKMLFGLAGTEYGQFKLEQITANNVADGFYLKCVAQTDTTKGYLTVDQTADATYLRAYDKESNALTTKSGFKFVIISKSKAFFDALSQSRQKTDPAQRLESLSNLIAMASKIENGQILLSEITRFVTDNKSSADWTSFNLIINGLMDKFKEIFGEKIASTPEYIALGTALTSEATTTVSGMPKDGDAVVIYSTAANKYLFVTKAKLPTGKDVFFITTTSDDPISASQFKIKETSAGSGKFGLESLNQDSASLVIQALPPVIQADSVESTRRQLTRLMLSPRPKIAFGQPGTEYEQFEFKQITESNAADGFYLKCVAQTDKTKGYLTVDQTTDATYLRAFDNTGVPLLQTAESGFKFVIISKSKTFFDALLKIRAETNPGTRLDLYATMIGSASSTENGTVLLNEIKRFVLENKKTATGWSDFKDNFGPKVEAIVATFNETFLNEIAATPTLKDARDALATTLSSIFIEKLTSGFYALAWINSLGEKKFLKLVSEDASHLEPADYTQQFKVCATGTDKLDPTAIFNVTVSDIEPSMQLETDYNKDSVISGPNIKNQGIPDAANFTKTKVADRSNDLAFKYLKVFGWREYADSKNLNKEDQAPFDFTFEGAMDNLKLKSKGNSGYLSVDQTTFCIKTTGDDGSALTSPSDNSSFALISLSGPEVELAKIRGKSVIDQITFYSSRAKQITPKTTNTLREQFVTEIEKFMNVVLSSPDKYRDAKANAAKIDELIKFIIDQKTVSTYKTIADRTLKIQSAWIAGFVGPVESEKSYVFSLSDPTLGSKIFKLEKSIDPNKDEYVLKTVDKLGKSDELDPKSRLKATVGSDNVVVFTTLFDGKTYTLSVLDDPTQKARSGIIAKILTTASGDNEKFLANTNEDMTISFKSLKPNCGFVTVDSTGFISTLSELTSEKAGLTDQNSNLIPTEQAKFQKTVLTKFHEDLSEFRNVTDDLSRLSKYLEKSIYKDVTPAQIDALAGEVIVWTTKIMDEKDPAHYKTLSTNKAFAGKLNTLFANVLKLIPAESPSKQLLTDTQTRWSGGAVNLLRNPIIPEDGKKIILSFTPAGGKKVYLRAAKDADSGNIILKADSELSIEPANVLQVAIDGEKIGFKSPSNQDSMLFSKSLPAEAIDWATKRKIIESALTFMPADATKFKNKIPSGCQFIVPKTATAESVSFQTVPYASDDPTKRVLQGFMSFSGSVTGMIRILSESTLQPLIGTEDKLTANERFSIILVNDVFNQAIELQKETDNEKIATALKAMIPLVKPATTDKIFFVDALKKVFKDKRDAKISNYIKEIITKIKDEWVLDDTSADVKQIQEILSTTTLLGNSYVGLVKESLKTLLQTPTAQRQAYVENNIGSQIKDWSVSLVDAWTDDVIKTDLKLADTDTNLARKIILERMRVISDFHETLKKFIPFDKTNKTGITEIKAAVSAKLSELNNQGLLLKPKTPTDTKTPSTPTNTGNKSYR